MLGVSFLFIFSAFQTCEMIQEVVLESTSLKIFQGSGYKSLSIIYGSFALCNWFAAPVVTFLGPKISLILGASTYCIFIGSFLNPRLWSLYVTSALLGLGAAILWTAQGNFLTIISDQSNISRNTGIFWALFQTSYVVGNTIMFVKFKGMTNLDQEAYSALFTILLVLCCTGVLMLITCLKNVAYENKLNHIDIINDNISTNNYTSINESERTALIKGDMEKLYSSSLTHHEIPQIEVKNDKKINKRVEFLENEYEIGTSSYLNNQNIILDQQKSNVFMVDNRNTLSKTLLTSFKLLKDVNILLLTFSFAFTGLEITFISGVLTTCIGYTTRFGDQSKSLMGICGILLGVGEILGGLNFGVLESFLASRRRVNNSFQITNQKGLSRCSTIITSGYLLNILSYFTLYLILPKDSPIQPSTLGVYLNYDTLSLVLVPVTALLLGFADSAFNTQIYVMIATHYREERENTATFALFKFIQSTMAAIAFYYSKYLLLHWQLLILVISGTFAVLFFYSADHRLSNNILEIKSRDRT
ncbi:unnamed protein product [Gordionus sp. m RMFG-2023]